LHSSDTFSIYKFLTVAVFKVDFGNCFCGEVLTPIYKSS